MIQLSTRPAAAAALLALALPAAALAQERYNVSGDHVAVFNLAGEVEVAGTRGNAVTVEVARGGADAGRLRVEVGEVSGRQALRVIYPADEVRYDADGWSGNTRLRVRDDGTWGGDGGSWWNGSGERVRIASRGSGMDAHADLRIGVPRGQRVDIYLAVGRISAENVDGRVRLDTHAGPIDARDMAGHLTLDTGSGRVTIEGMDGDLEVDTGSGSVRAMAVTGERVGIDTGSGSVEAAGIRAREIEIDTGSGRIELRRSAGSDIRLDTGSGSVDAELTADVDDLVVDTGSGSVTLRLPGDVGASIDLETGSGGIDVEVPVRITRRARDELRGEIGDGRGRIKVDTGSGGIRIRQG